MGVDDVCMFYFYWLQIKQNSCDMLFVFKFLNGEWNYEFVLIKLPSTFLVLFSVFIFILLGF